MSLSSNRLFLSSTFVNGGRGWIRTSDIWGISPTRTASPLPYHAGGNHVSTERWSATLPILVRYVSIFNYDHDCHITFLLADGFAPQPLEFSRQGYFPRPRSFATAKLITHSFAFTMVSIRPRYALSHNQPDTFQLVPF